jgi:hypothetical protein
LKPKNFAPFSREVFQLGWPDYNGNVKEIKLRPSKIGLKLRGDKSVSIYLQKHALQRLEERLGIVTGISHYHLYATLKSNNPVAHPQGTTTLVEYSIYEKKLRYLVCGIYEEQIVVRIFLFLTNDGTPEGNRLSELTRLGLLDKQYLGIDTLEGFLRFGIAEDPALKELFTRAGCESLLDMDDVKPFVVSKVAPKDPALLLQYLIGMGQQTQEFKTYIEN